jgi:sec-independent protein translocase protein TatA
MTCAPLPFAFLPDIGGGEVLVVLLLVLLLFGGDKMPQLAKGIGKSLREFKKAAGAVEEEFKRALDEVPDSPPPGRAAPTVPRNELPVNRVFPPFPPPPPSAPPPPAP